MENANLKLGLKTEIELALSGEGGSPEGRSRGVSPEPSVLLLIRQGRMPAALVTDARGVSTPKTLDYVDLLSALDNSAVVTELEKDPVREHEIPDLPAGALLLSMTERPSGNSFVVTGTAPPATHLFVVDGGGETTTYEVPLPHVAYRAEWESATRSVRLLSLALCSPEGDATPTADTEIYRYPFSNVYGSFGGVLEGVCWPTLGSIETTLAQIPERIIGGFFAVPNDAERYTRDLSKSAPFSGYREFLGAVEERGGLEHDWLEPCSMTVRDLHDQARRES